MWDRTTECFRSILHAANRLAVLSEREQIPPESILHALLTEGNVATAMLRASDIPIDQVRIRIASEFGAIVPGIETEGSAHRQDVRSLPLSADSEQVIMCAFDEADRQGHYTVDEAHLLLGFIRQEAMPSVQMLFEMGVTLESVRGALRRLIEPREPIAAGYPFRQLNDVALEDILTALQCDSRDIREEALKSLQGYLHAFEANAEGESEPRQILRTAGRHSPIDELQDDRVIGALLTAIDDEYYRVRVQAALLLGHMRVMKAQNVLIDGLLHDPVDAVRTVCLMALGHFNDSEAITTAMIAALQDSSEQVASAACIRLGKIGTVRAIEPLRLLINHQSWIVRYRACVALIKLQAATDEVVRSFDEANEHPEAQEQKRRWGLT